MSGSYDDAAGAAALLVERAPGAGDGRRCGALPALRRGAGVVRTAAQQTMERAVTERQHAERTVAYARLRGWLAYYVHDSRHSPAGWPDLVLIRGLRTLFVELKSETGQPSAEQQECLEAIRDAGQEWYFWRPSDFDAILEVLA